MSWIFFAILCAALSGLRDFLAKISTKSISSSSIAFFQYLIGAPILLLVASFQPLPTVSHTFYPALLGAMVLISFGTLAFFKAIELSDVSLMAPLRSLTLPCLLILAPIAIGEKINLQGIFGVLIITAGLFVISFSRNSSIAFSAYRKAEGTKYILQAVLLFSVCALCEKVGVKNSSSIFFFACETTLACLGIGSILLVQGRFKISYSMHDFKRTLPVGLSFALMFIAQSLALVDGPVTFVIALKRCGVILTVFLGSVVLHEGATVQRILGTLVVLLGALLISFS